MKIYNQIGKTNIFYIMKTILFYLEYYEKFYQYRAMESRKVLDTYYTYINMVDVHFR